MIGDQLETDPVSIADGFDNYFSQIAEKLQQDVFNGRNHFWNYLKDPLDHNFIFRSVDAIEIMLINDRFI